MESFNLTEVSGIQMVGQEIRFCRAKDGVRIGYTAMGKGPPLIKAANYLTHPEHDRKSPVWQHWLKGLSSRHTFIRYDARGSGLSDWDVDHYSINTWVQVESRSKAIVLARESGLGKSYFKSYDPASF